MSMVRQVLGMGMWLWPKPASTSGILAMEHAEVRMTPNLCRSGARAAGGRALLDLGEHRAGLECVSRVEGFLCHEDLLHDPLTIDDERRAAGDDVLFVEDPVGAADVALGIAQNVALYA